MHLKRATTNFMDGHTIYNVLHNAVRGSKLLTFDAIPSVADLTHATRNCPFVFLLDRPYGTHFADSCQRVCSTRNHAHLDVACDTSLLGKLIVNTTYRGSIRRGCCCCCGDGKRACTCGLPSDACHTHACDAPSHARQPSRAQSNGSADMSWHTTLQCIGHTVLPCEPAHDYHSCESKSVQSSKLLPRAADVEQTLSPHREDEAACYVPLLMSTEEERVDVAGLCVDSVVLHVSQWVITGSDLVMERFDLVSTKSPKEDHNNEDEDEYTKRVMSVQGGYSKRSDFCCNRIYGEVYMTDAAGPVCHGRLQTGSLRDAGAAAPSSWSLCRVIRHHTSLDPTQLDETMLHDMHMLLERDGFHDFYRDPCDTDTAELSLAASDAHLRGFTHLVFHTAYPLWPLVASAAARVKPGSRLTRTRPPATQACETGVRSAAPERVAPAASRLAVLVNRCRAELAFGAVHKKKPLQSSPDAELGKGLLSRSRVNSSNSALHRSLVVAPFYADALSYLDDARRRRVTALRFMSRDDATTAACASAAVLCERAPPPPTRRAWAQHPYKSTRVPPCYASLTHRTMSLASARCTAPDDRLPALDSCAAPSSAQPTTTALHACPTAEQGDLLLGHGDHPTRVRAMAMASLVCERPVYTAAVRRGWARWARACEELCRSYIVNLMDEMVHYVQCSRAAFYTAVACLDRFVALCTDPRRCCYEFIHADRGEDAAVVGTRRSEGECTMRGTRAPVCWSSSSSSSSSSSCRTTREDVTGGCCVATSISAARRRCVDDSSSSSNNNKSCSSLAHVATVSQTRSFLTQVIAVCAMLGCKAVDSYPPPVSAMLMCLRTDTSVSAGEFVRLEQFVLRTLDYRLHTVTLHEAVETLMFMLGGDDVYALSRDFPHARRHAMLQQGAPPPHRGPSHCCSSQGQGRTRRRQRRLQQQQQRGGTCELDAMEMSCWCHVDEAAPCQGRCDVEEKGAAWGGAACEQERVVDKACGHTEYVEYDSDVTHTAHHPVRVIRPVVAHACCTNQEEGHEGCEKRTGGGTGATDCVSLHRCRVRALMTRPSVRAWRRVNYLARFLCDLTIRGVRRAVSRTSGPTVSLALQTSPVLVAVMLVAVAAEFNRVALPSPLLALLPRCYRRRTGLCGSGEEGEGAERSRTHVPLSDSGNACAVFPVGESDNTYRLLRYFAWLMQVEYALGHDDGDVGAATGAYEEDETTGKRSAAEDADEKGDDGMSRILMTLREEMMERYRHTRKEECDKILVQRYQYMRPPPSEKCGA